MTTPTSLPPPPPSAPVPSSPASAPAHPGEGWRGLRRWPFGGLPATGVGAATLHLLLGLPVAIVAFVATVVLGMLSVSLLVLYPLALMALTAWVVTVRGTASFERARVRALLGYAIPAPPRPTAQGSWHARLWRTVASAATWRAVVYNLVRLPLAIVLFVLTIVAWSVPAALLALPLSLIGTPIATLPLWVPLVVAGGLVLGLVLLPLVAGTVDAFARLDAAVAGALLGVSPGDLRERRIEQLATSRSDLVDIAEQERRRIERDLHDGAGQQLVSLAMTLGMAREKLRHDPAAASHLIDEAHAEAKQALAGLRDIVRGISPAILTDRGLGAALSAVAARSPLPVSLVVEIPQRPDAATEGIAYYVVCEAIANASRHAGASAIRVSIVRNGDVLDVEVHDDGRGDADPARGTGLRGLAGRVAAVDGALDVTSPPGGPTVVRASLPIRDRQDDPPAPSTAGP